MENLPCEKKSLQTIQAVSTTMLAGAKPYAAVFETSLAGNLFPEFFEALQDFGRRALVVNGSGSERIHLAVVD